jgi:uncharacterized protein involved in exopolysaccharide biosynthesis
MVQSTVTDDMSARLRALREAVISRPYMVRLIEEIYGETDDPMELERRIRSVSSRVEVTLMRIDPRRGGGMFRLSARDNESQRAADIVNTLARLYIDQNVRFRTDQAEDNAATMGELAEEVEAQLRIQEDAIARFKERHLYDTSEHFHANLQQLSTSREELESNGRSLILVQDRLQGLLAQEQQARMFAAAVAPDMVQTANPASTRYVMLRSELAALRAKYHEDHPDVRRKQAELDDFLAENSGALGADPAEGSVGTDGEPVASPYASQIQASRREIERLKEEEARIQRDIETYKRRIENTPRVDQELTELTKDYGVSQEKYRGYLAKVEDARAAVRIEEAQQGERFEVIAEATAPMFPIRPVPTMVYGIGVMGCLALFVGPIVLRWLLIPTVASEAGLRSLTEVPVLTTVNEMATPEVRRIRRNRVLLNVFASALAMSVLVIVTELLP